MATIANSADAALQAELVRIENAPLADNLIVDFAAVSGPTRPENNATVGASFDTGGSGFLPYSIAFSGDIAIGVGDINNIFLKLSDPYWALVRLLLHCNGVNGETGVGAVRDSSDYAVAASICTATIDTSRSKFGGASFAFNGSSKYIQYTTGFNPGTADFDLEFWVYLNSTATEQCFVDFLTPGGTGQRSDAVVFLMQAGGKLNFFSNGGFRLQSATVLAAGVWIKINFIRVGGVFKYMINGSFDANSISYSVNISSNGASIGKLSDSSGDYLNGNLDEIRYTPGVVRHSSNYTPENEEF